MSSGHGIRGVPLDQFNKKLDEYANKLPQLIVNDVQASVMRQLYMYLMIYTPIDTGALRGNWKVSIDKKPRGASKRRRTDATQTGVPATPTEIAYVEGFAKALKALPLGRTVWIGNFLNYAKFVEFGTSRMDPRAMLDKSRVATIAKIQSGQVRFRNIKSPFG